MKPTITIIISTYGDRIKELQESCYPILNNVCYLIIWQRPIVEFSEDWIEKRSDFSLLESNEIGLSKSRNLGVSSANSEYCLITDDDTEIIREGLRKLLKYIKKNKIKNMIIVKVLNSKEEEFRAYNNFESEGISLKRRILSVCSVEMCFPKELWEKQKFNENIGLGTSYPVGEDTIFNYGLYMQNVTFEMFKNHVIKLHDDNHTGESRSPKVLYTKGIIAAYVWKLNPLFIVNKIYEFFISLFMLKYEERYYFKGLVDYIFCSSKYRKILEGKTDRIT